MCGITGFIQLDHTLPAQEVLHAMADAMRLRGPDGEGFFTEESLALAHRRLAVIDLVTGDQPMTSSAGDCVIVFNGEIFNYRELKQELEAKGHVFRTGSDTEVILELYRAEGVDAVRRLNGFFAFALYDRNAKRLLIARDRLGVKPLYYFRNDSVFAFASSLAALKRHPAFPAEKDPCALTEFLAFQYVPGNRTLYRDVQQLSPAHFMTIDLNTGATAFQRYWSVADVKKCVCTYDEAREELRTLLSDAVKRRMIADVPLGVFLSGGLDSAVVAALAAEHTDTPLHCFSIAFADPAYDESHYAKETAEYIRNYTGKEIVHDVRTVDPCDVSLLEFLAAEYAEPYADASMLPTCLLSRFTRESVTVALSGDGADELFGGYDRYRAMKMLSRLPMPRKVAGMLAHLIPAGGERTHAGRIRRLLKAASLAPAERYRFIMSHGADSITARTALFDPAGRITEELPFSWDPAWHYPVQDMQSYMPGDVLRKVDVCSMANSLEVRSPFLDYRVAEFALSLPADWKLKGKQRKRIVSEAFAEKLPPGLPMRKKRGFGVPVAAWFRNEWQGYLKEHLLTGELDTLFRRDELAALIAEHAAGTADHSYYLFSLLMLTLSSR